MNNYKKQPFIPAIQKTSTLVALSVIGVFSLVVTINSTTIDIYCLLYTSEADDDLLCIDLGGRSINKKK